MYYVSGDDKIETIHLQILCYKFFLINFMERSRKKKLFWQILMATMTGDKWSTSVGPDILIHYQGSASSVWPSSDQNRNVWFVFHQFKKPNFLAFSSANILISKKISLFFHHFLIVGQYGSVAVKCKKILHLHF